MYSIVIQPYNYQTIKTLSDIKSVSIMKFSRRPFRINSEEIGGYDVVYEGALTEEVIKMIFENVNNNNVITYNRKLLARTMHAIENECPQYTFDSSKIIGLMEDFITVCHKPSDGRPWYKLADLLKHYGSAMPINRDDPTDMAQGTVLLYRFIQKDEKFNEYNKEHNF